MQDKIIPAQVAPLFSILDKLKSFSSNSGNPTTARWQDNVWQEETLVDHEAPDLTMIDELVESDAEEAEDNLPKLAIQCNGT
mgnify:CR=1 FL=1